MSGFQLNRRDAITSLLAISAAGALAACGPAEPSAPDKTPDLGLNYAEVGKFFSADEMAFLSVVANTIIPETETAGAIGAGVPETLQGLASVWGDNNYRKYWREGVQGLKAALTTDDGQDFSALSAEARNEALARFDAGVFDGTIDNRFYRDMKGTVVQAYYMSEPGATEELAYEPVPGEWIGCVPLSDYPKTWAT